MKLCLLMLYLVKVKEWRIKYFKWRFTENGLATCHVTPDMGYPGICSLSLFLYGEDLDLVVNTTDVYWSCEGVVF